jgi:hypothetical protein
MSCSLRLNRRLGRRLTVRLCHRLNRGPDGRILRPKNLLYEVCTLIARYTRMRERAARRDPHLFGRHASEYYQDTLRLEREQREIDAALDRVYGPDPAASASGGSRHSVWTERYYIEPGQERLFRKWFRETYG